MRSRSPSRLVITTVVALLAAGCSAGDGRQASADPEAAGAAAAPSLAELVATAELVDLSYAYDEETLYWPTSPSAFALTRLHHGPTDGGYFYSANAFCTPEHGGTHLDAPIHFGAGQAATDEIPLTRLIAPAVVIDVAAAAAADPDYRLTREDVEAWEKRHGEVPHGAIVLLYTGWGERWPDRRRYLGDDTPGDASNLHFPSYGEAAARYLIAERGAAVLGVDTASIDHGPSTDFMVHRVAAAADVPGLENVARLERLPATGAVVAALPVKIAGGSGGPVRIVAMVPREAAAGQER